MSPIFDVSGSDERDPAIEAAHAAVGEGKLVVLPTDTVYGVGADPFNPDSVAALLAAKGRGRDKPPAVLVPNPATVEGLAMNVPSYARRLMDRFWPGGLTLIFRAQPSLMWDLGDTNGTVGLRMPDHEIALELLQATGPLAVSSANRTGQPPVTTITEAGFAFGPAVEVYLDGGTCDDGLPSTILDCTKPDPVMLRRGTITPAQLREVLGPISLLDSTGAPLSETPQDAPETDNPQQHESASNPAPESTDDERTAERQRLEAMGARARAGEATQAIPLGGIGAEPPFEPESVTSVELPGRPGEQNH